MTVSLAQLHIRRPARRQRIMLPLTPLDALLTRDPVGDLGAAAEGRSERRSALRRLSVSVMGMAVVMVIAVIGATLAIRELVSSFMQY
jgi:hypothetical protein